MVAAEPAGPFGGPGLSATASSRPGRLAVTIINREYSSPVIVNMRTSGTVTSSWLLTAETPDDGNDAGNPERVSPRRLVVDDSRAGRTTVNLPPHSMAKVEFATDGAGLD